MDEAEEAILDELRGRRIVEVHRGEGGLHIDLDDDKTIIVLGIIGVVQRTDTMLQ